MNPTSSEDEQVISYLNFISLKYTDLKKELQTSQLRIKELELENVKLRNKLSKKISSEYQHQSTDVKKRKTLTLDHSKTSLFANAVADQSDLAGPNDTQNSFGQADEFNVAIRDMSSRTDDEDEVDEEEISATPVVPTSAIKRERFKTTLKDQSTPNPKPKEGKISKYPFEQTPNAKCSLSVVQGMPQIKCEPNMSSVQLSSSPLRTIQNDASLWSTSCVGNSWISTKNRPVKQENRPSAEWSSSDDPLDVSTKSSDLHKDHRTSGRKSLSLASGKYPRLKQSLLDFSVEKAKRKLSAADLDVTYCDDLISQQKSKNASIFFQKNNSDCEKNLFDFDARRKSIKLEPTTQQRDNSKPQHTTIPSRTPDYASNSSSVFALPSQTDEIVIVEDTPPLFASQDINSELLEPERCIRTDYKQRVDVRTIKEKAAQPGFMCPDCAPWFKYIGAGLSDREIQRRLDQCSRHRRDQDLPSTPEGFWVPYFMPTQEEDKQETLVHYRLKSKQVLKDQSYEA